MSTSLFRGEHLTLRPPAPADALALADYLNHPDLIGCRYLPDAFPDDRPLFAGRIDALIEEWNRAERGLHLLIALHGEATPIGYAGADWGWDPHAPSLWVVIAPGWRRRGFGREAAYLLLRYLFGYTPAHNVSAWIMSWNSGARSFARSLGFIENGGPRRLGIRDGAFYDGVIVDLLRPEWKQQRGGEYHAAGR